MIGALVRFRVLLALMGTAGMVCCLPQSLHAQDGAKKLALDGRFAGPRWSPDGKMIGVTGPGYSGIYVVQADGSKFRRITDDEAAGYRFAWSPDSKQIAFKSRKHLAVGINYALKVASVDGAGVKTVAERQTDMGVPVWLSGDTLGVLLDGKATEARLDGTLTGKVTGAKANSISWLAGNEQVVCVEDDRVVLLQADGSRKFLTSVDDGRFYDLQLSPASDKALVHNLDGHLYLIALPDGSRTDLGEGAAASWSPDGKSILCNVATDDGHEITGSDIFIIDVAGKSRKQITRTKDRIEMYAAFAPDGKRIAYQDTRSGSIFVQDIAEGVAK